MLGNPKETVLHRRHIVTIPSLRPLRISGCSHQNMFTFAESSDGLHPP